MLGSGSRRKNEWSFGVRDEATRNLMGNVKFVGECSLEPLAFSVHVAARKIREEEKGRKGVGEIREVEKGRKGVGDV
jgi:hypothetical protein